MIGDRTQYVCLSDRWASRADLYDSVDDFVGMCAAVHGEAPALSQRGTMDYYEGDELVLQAVVELAPWSSGAAYALIAGLVRASGGVKPTLAQNVSRLFRGANSTFVEDDVAGLGQVCRDAGAYVVSGRGGSSKRYVFDDESAITVHGGAWDLGWWDCWCWRGANGGRHDEGCEGQASAAAEVSP